MSELFNCQTQSDIIKCIEENPKLINKIKNFGNMHTPLSFFSDKGNFEITYALLTHGANPINYTLERGAIQHAASKGHIMIIDILIKFGVNINDTSDLEKKAPLHCAAIYNHISLVEYLMSISNIDLNIRDRFRMTPLMYACKNGNVEVVKCLLKNGANIGLHDNNKHDAFFHACSNQNTEIIDILIFYGADISRNIGTTPLSLAIKHGRYNMVEKLIDIRCNINEKISYGYTPIILSVIINNLEIFNFLLDKGANIEISDNIGMTSLHYAAELGYKNIVISLLNNISCDINKSNNAGKTALMIACKNGHVEIVDMLLKAGANIHLIDNYGYNALCFSCISGNLDIFDTLINHSGNTTIIYDNLLAIAKEYESIDIIKKIAELTSTKFEPVNEARWNIFD